MRSMPGSWPPRCFWRSIRGIFWPLPRSETAQWSCPTDQGAYATFLTPQRGGVRQPDELPHFIGRHVQARRQGRARERQFGDRLAMFTDGLQNLVLRAEDDSPHAPFFNPVSSPGSVHRHVSDDTDRKLAAFLESPRVTNRADDDLTLLLAALKE